MSKTRKRNIEALNDLGTRMDGFAGRNWRDEYPGYEQLNLAEKNEMLKAEYED